MKSATLLALLLAAGATTADKPFVSGGYVNIQLEGGEYEIRAAADNHLRVTFSGNIGNAVADVTTNERRATIKVTNTPRSGNFRAVIEVPKTADLVVRLTGGDLAIRPIAGNKDVDVTAGDVKIEAGSPDDYASVDATVRIGDLSAGPFGDAKGSFLSKTLSWSGHGKYKLLARLGAGDLKFR